jgi:hypothetical protein
MCHGRCNGDRPNSFCIGLCISGRNPCSPGRSHGWLQMGGVCRNLGNTALNHHRCPSRLCLHNDCNLRCDCLPCRPYWAHYTIHTVAAPQIPQSNLRKRACRPRYGLLCGSHRSHCNFREPMNRLPPLRHGGLLRHLSVHLQRAPVQDACHTKHIWQNPHSRNPQLCHNRGIR